MTRHVPVLLNEILSFVPETRSGKLLDVTAGGGGHFFAILEARPSWSGVCWDRDPAARERILVRANELGLNERVAFEKKTFALPPHQEDRFEMILADIGVSSFQLDDPQRGMSLFSEQAPDFRMDPQSGATFSSWLKHTSEYELVKIFEEYGEEPRAKKLARAMKSWKPESYSTARQLADGIAIELGYKSHSRVHPATRAFQAMRIAINDELGELRSLMSWGPEHLNAGGRMAVISFHSLEDRVVKNEFRARAAHEGTFCVLTKKPLEASEAERRENPRARSAKLRVLERSLSVG
jgi:16S rRNA (cytosine1402-N4)-methyltransferase